MRLALIGPGDIEFHYQQTLGIEKDKFDSQLKKIAKALADSGAEIELLPDKGVSLEIARLYKQKNGRKVIGTIPKQDQTFGIKHLELYINEKIDDKPLLDETIDTENWFKHDLIKGILGDAILYLGSSPGTNGELNYAIYLYKIISGQKENLNVLREKIHPEIRAGNNFTLFVYSPFLKRKKLPPEEEAYLKKFNINLVYIKYPKQLKEELEKFKLPSPKSQL